MRNFIPMKTKVNIDDFLTLINWVKTFLILNQKSFNYENLLDQAETYKLKDTPLDISIHYIDDLMIDALKLYFTLKETKETVNEFVSKYNLFDKDQMISEIEKYERICEDLLENYKYEDPEIRGIQKGFLSERIKKYIEVEDYENAAKIRDTINEI